MKNYHHTKEKGDLGVLKAQVDLFEQGYTICVPLTEHSPFDLVGYKNGKFTRIQVKYRSVDKYGKIDVKFSTSWSDVNGTHTVPVDKTEVDLYCVYCPETDECYYIRPNEFSVNATLRVRPPKNNQQKLVRYAADYRRAP